MTSVLPFTRRGMMLGAVAGLLGACARDRFVIAPVVIGGSAVSAQAPIMEAIAASADHRRLAEALRATGLDAALSGPGPFTLLAPTDAAFDTLRPRVESDRLRADTALLGRTLRGHILPARLSGAEIDAGIEANGGETKALGLNGIPVSFDREGADTRVYDVRRRRGLLRERDAIAVNGLIHVIDEVLLLPQAEPDEANAVSP